LKCLGVSLRRRKMAKMKFNGLETENIMKIIDRLR
jgi:hypothetical protein